MSAVLALSLKLSDSVSLVTENAWLQKLTAYFFYLNTYTYINTSSIPLVFSLQKIRKIRLNIVCLVLLFFVPSKVFLLFEFFDLFLSLKKIAASRRKRTI